MQATRADIVLPKRRRRKVQKRPTGRRRLVMALLLALAIGIGVNLATRPRLSPGNPELLAGETGAALESWSDSAGNAALRSRRLERLAATCPAAPPQRRSALLDSFPGWPDDVLGLVACRRIRSGFSVEQLRAAWGTPLRVIPDLAGMRPVEQWDYGSHSVLIWDGAIRSWE
jgi:hypothetical protein